MARTSRRGPWLPEEDSALIELVRTQGPNNWVRISQQLQHRSPKQCRERYHQNLKPSLNHDPISPAEGERIEQLVEEMGKRWAEIARRLGNRSDNAVKNWWNGSINRRKRSPSSQNSLRHSGSRLHSVPTTVPQLPPFEFGDRAVPNGPASAPLHYGFQNPWSSHRDTSPGHTAPAASSFDHYARRATVIAPPTAHEAYHLREQPRYSESFSYEGHREHGDARSRLPPLRLPPISSSRVDSICITGVEKPSVSPALSDFSHAYSTRPVPSLVSDNQSSCSVSPKTLTSPRTRATPYSGESRDHRWSYPERPQSGSYQGIKGQMPLSPLQLETLVMPPILNTLGVNASTYQPIQYHDGGRTTSYEQATTTRTEPLRDSRMHVSSLVQ